MLLLKKNTNASFTYYSTNTNASSEPESLVLSRTTRCSCDKLRGHGLGPKTISRYLVVGNSWKESVVELKENAAIHCLEVEVDDLCIVFVVVYEIRQDGYETFFYDE